MLSHKFVVYYYSHFAENLKVFLKHNGGLEKTQAEHRSTNHTYFLGDFHFTHTINHQNQSDSFFSHVNQNCSVIHYEVVLERSQGIPQPLNLRGIHGGKSSYCYFLIIETVNVLYGMSLDTICSQY